MGPKPTTCHLLFCKISTAFATFASTLGTVTVAAFAQTAAALSTLGTAAITTLAETTTALSTLGAVTVAALGAVAVGAFAETSSPLWSKKSNSKL